MIKTPVTYDHRNDQIIDSDNNVIAYDVDYRFAEDQVKRINLHNELVAALDEILETTVMPRERQCELMELRERCK